MATLSLCVIAKNEALNLPILDNSIDGCFDEKILVDTGSTDTTVEVAKALGWTVYHFEWVYDFAKARNFAFSKATCDYICWLDCDDILSDKNFFLKWKKELMPIANYWLNTYDYASNERDDPVCSFARERVVKRSAGFEWKYFVHEGIAPVGKEPCVSMFASSWRVKHRRTPEDLAKDKGRNIGIFERQTEPLDARMQYYYGKELFENGRPMEGYTQLVSAAKRSELDPYDRILCLQYACQSAIACNQFPEAIDLAIRGLQLAPTRAEFFSILGDCHSALMKPSDAIPYYKAAKNCPRSNPRSAFGSPIFTFEPAYGVHPTKQLARAYFAIGDLQSAIDELNTLPPFQMDDEAQKLLVEIQRVQEKVKLPTVETGKRTEDIVISCPPEGLYEWDEHIYETLGCGGSETAAIEMARNLHKLTGRQVIIFNNRITQKDFGGVSYRPALKLMDYMGQNIPKAHIAWRHTDKVTVADTYVWCHDLFAQGIEDHSRYHKVLALSEFHKNFLVNLFGVPEEKIIVTRNGINPRRWDDFKPNKKDVVVYTSSPDRGLERALEVMDLVVKEMPHVQFKVYYGYDNMLKLGKKDQVDFFQQMFNARPWATMVGNVEQQKLIEELSEAKAWLYPTNFLETHCISALEAVHSQVWPVVRSYGALPHTLKNLPGELIERDCVTHDDKAYYAERVISALRENKWQTMNEGIEKHSWESVGKEWVEIMNLK